MRLRVLSRPHEEILTVDEFPTIDLLRRTGFLELILSRFFRPSFGRIFFEKELETTSRLCNFIFKCLAFGDNALPAKGIVAIPKQLVAKLPSKSILYNSRAVSIDPEGFDYPAVRLQTEEILKSELGVIVAVDQHEADKLLADKIPPVQRKPARSTLCLYFSADRENIPVQDPVLFLNGSGEGIVNNMLFPTNVAKSYGPPRKALVSLLLIGRFGGILDEDLTAECIREILSWFKGTDVGSWKHSKTYSIAFAQPNQSPPTNLIKDSVWALVCTYEMTS